MENGKEDLAGKFISRTVSSIILMTFVMGVVYFIPNWMFTIVISLFIAAGMFEFFRMVEKRDIFVYKYFGTVVGCLIPVVIFMEGGFPEMKNWGPILIVTATLLTFILQLIRRDNAKDHLVSMALTLFALFYIGWFFSFFVQLKILENGSNLVAFLVIVTKSADIGAYLIGSRLGRSELIPRISPKKTKEGTIGGILFSVVVSVVVGRFLTGFSLLHLTMLGFILATLGQVGDLAESLIKRDCGVKDSGAYFSGIGGVLDLIDSLLFTAPVFWFYVKTF
ncbi:phosphatidate cytidylyltransferase [Candidatus Omnitrophota bacterium]